MIITQHKVVYTGVIIDNRSITEIFMNKRIYHILAGKLGVRLEIRALMWQTARAFDVHMPGTTGFSASELLRSYAGFSADITSQAIRTEQDLDLLRGKLYHRAYRLGSLLRGLMKPKDEKEQFEILVLLYRNIGITINEERRTASEESRSKFCVTRCYFSEFYTPGICSVISALDEGIFAGMYDVGSLKFKERITEGNDVCLADFKRRT